MNKSQTKRTELTTRYWKVHGGDFYLQARERNENKDFISERAQETGLTFNHFAH